MSGPDPDRRLFGMASTLAEMKSPRLVPSARRGGNAGRSRRGTISRQLLEYKKYRDAASMLEERGRQWRESFPRATNDSAPSEAAGELVEEAQLWDLVGALSRVLRENQIPQGPSIIYDDTPIHVHMSRITEQLRRQPRLAFENCFSRACTSRRWWASFSPVGIDSASPGFRGTGGTVSRNLDHDALYAASEPDPSDLVDNYDHPKSSQNAGDAAQTSV